VLEVVVCLVPWLLDREHLDSSKFADLSLEAGGLSRHNFKFALGRYNV
jgi:hypothetical protein